MENKKSNTYVGTYDEKEWYQVTLNGIFFNPAPSQKVHNHSPDGFSWGYGGAGPAQLALAIILLETDKETAIDRHQQFKNEVIAGLNREQGFTLTSEDVQRWLGK